MVWREGWSQKIAEGGLEMFQEKRSLDKKSEWVGVLWPSMKLFKGIYP